MLASFLCSMWLPAFILQNCISVVFLVCSILWSGLGSLICHGARDKMSCFTRGCWDTYVPPPIWLWYTLLLMTQAAKAKWGKAFQTEPQLLVLPCLLSKLSRKKQMLDLKKPIYQISPRMMSYHCWLIADMIWNGEMWCKIDCWSQSCLKWSKLRI